MRLLTLVNLVRRVRPRLEGLKRWLELTQRDGLVTEECLDSVGTLRARDGKSLFLHYGGCAYVTEVGRSEVELI